MASSWPSRDFGGVELLDQIDDAVLEMPLGHVVVARGLQQLDLVGERLHQRFQLRRDRGAVLLPLGQGLGQSADALVEMIERIVAARRMGDVVDLFAQHLHFGGERADRVAGGDVGRHLAQRIDGAFELRHRLRVFLRHDEIDLVSEPVDRLVEADELFRRRQPVQRVAHLGQAVLDTDEGAVVDAVLSAFRDSLGEAGDLLLDGLDLAPRHSVVERIADPDQFAAQGVDRLLNARFAQGLDLVGDTAELVLQPGQVLRRQRRAYRRRRRGRGRLGRRGPGRRHNHRLRQAGLLPLRLRHRRLGLRRRPLGLLARSCRRWDGLAAVQRALARGDLGHRMVEARRQLDVGRGRRWRRWLPGPMDELLKPLAETADLGGLRLGAVLGLGLGIVLGLAPLAPRSVGGGVARRGTGARHLLDAAGEIVQPLVHAGEIFAVEVLVVRRQALMCGLLKDHGVEPISQGHARPACRFLRCFAGFRANPLHAPRDVEFHRCRFRVAKPDPAPWNGYDLTSGGRAPSAVLECRLFANQGKQAVNGTASRRI